MSLAPDPADRAPVDTALDAKADGQFAAAGGAHRSGYTRDQLAWVRYWAGKGATLAAGEGLILLKEIQRLEAVVATLTDQLAANE
jgi:hypothetical protein